MYVSLRHRQSVLDFISIVAIASVHPPSIYVYKASRHDHVIAGCISVGIASVYGSVHSASRHRYSIVAYIYMSVTLATVHISGYCTSRHRYGVVLYLPAPTEATVYIFGCGCFGSGCGIEHNFFARSLSAAAFARASVTAAAGRV